VSLLILGQEQLTYVLIAEHGATWRGTGQLHHGAEYAARGIVQIRHPDIRKGKNKFRCPNCGGNHEVTHSSFLARVIACEKQENRSEGASENANGQQSTTQNEGKNRGTQKKRGAPRSSGPGRQ
jgi:predicted RNA-binding Zn-ribbon protein involved in translation (DUF1610 family)